MAPDEALSIATLAKEILPFLTLLGIGMLLLFSWARAGSAHFLRERIWAILGGSKEFHDTYLNEQWKKVRDLENARYRTGIRFQSRSNAADTFAWLDSHDIPLDDLLRGARYFDPSKVQMKNPNLRAKTIAFVVALGLLLLLGAGTTAFSLSSYALLTVKKTGTAFWIDGETALAWNKAWITDAKSCSANTAPIEDEHDKNVICSLLMADADAFVEKSLKSQKYVGGSLIIFFFSLIVLNVRTLDQARSAQKMHVKTNRQVPIQLDLELK